jgi:hypothetical protein
MSNKEYIETKYFKWNTFVAISAIVCSTVVSIFTVRQQHNYWKVQNSIIAKEKIDGMKVKKIEQLVQCYMDYYWANLKFVNNDYNHSHLINIYRILGDEKDMDFLAYDFTPALRRESSQSEEEVFLKASKFMFHLKTVKTLFSDEIFNNAEELSELLHKFGYEIPDNEVENKFDSAKTIEELDKIYAENKPVPKEEFDKFKQQFRALIDKMYLEVQH